MLFNEELLRAGRTRWFERCLDRLGDAKAGRCQPPVHCSSFLNLLTEVLTK